MFGFQIQDKKALIVMGFPQVLLLRGCLLSMLKLAGLKSNPVYNINTSIKARIMLMEKYKIQKGSIHSYQFAMDAAA